MADLLVDNQSAPSTPASGKSVIWIDTTSKRLVQTDDGGIHRAGTLSKNYATGQQTGFATDTYLTGSNILIPSWGMQIGQLYEWRVGITKTAAGTTAWAVAVRIGAAGAIGDSSRLTLTQTVAQAATASGTHLLVTVQVRTVSASGVIVGIAGVTASQFGSGVHAVSSTFDNSAVGGQYIGLSLNGGTSASYTIDLVHGHLIQ